MMSKDPDFKKYSFFLIILFAFISVNSFSQKINPNGYNKFTYSNGTVSSEGNMKNGQPVGYWKSYYPDGQLKAHGNRKSEKLDSIWKFYDRNGNLTEIIDYKNNIKSGYYKKFKFIDDSLYKGNILVSKELYVDGEKNGKSYYYNDRGSLHKTVVFTKNYKNGYEKHYDKEGNINLIIKYSFNNIVDSEKLNRKDYSGRKQGIWKTFYGNDKIESYSNYVNDTLNGYYRHYNVYGELLKTEFYVMGEIKVLDKNEETKKKVTVKKEYFPDGEIKSSGSYIKDIPIGIHRTYDTLGNVIDSKTYSEKGDLLAIGIVNKDGKREGEWEFLYEEGKVKSKGNFVNGKKEGFWNYFYLSGITEQKGEYLKGRPEGEWFWFYENLKIRRNGKFINGKETGFFYELTEEGDTLSKGNYQFGLKTGEWVYSVNDMIQKGKYSLGKKEGLWQHYFSNEKLKFEGYYIEGFKDGKHKTFYPNGMIKEIAFYSMDNKDKKWKNYDKEGNLTTITEYRGGKKYKIDGQKVKDK